MGEHGEEDVLGRVASARRVRSGDAHVERGELDAVVLKLSEREAGRLMLGALHESTEPLSEK